ncbi:MAG TPA: hypothetical protein VGJ44_24175 [Kribbellaceae bacterium]
MPRALLDTSGLLLGGDPFTRHEAVALNLIAPADAVICRRNAARLYGVDALASETGR